jgi:hypothetical protein
VWKAWRDTIKPAIKHVIPVHKLFVPAVLPAADFVDSFPAVRSPLTAAAAPSDSGLSIAEMTDSIVLLLLLLLTAEPPLLATVSLRMLLLLLLAAAAAG